MAKRRIKVLIIDDSATMRGLMAHVVESDPELEVVGYAGDAYGAREAIKTLNPDVVTLDIEMPRMDGLTFLEKLMRLRPIPVVVVTSKTDAMDEIEGAALKLGAAHCLFKPQGLAGAELFDALPDKIKEAVDQGAAKAPEDRAEQDQISFNPRKHIFLGASTGGVDALVSVLRTFPKNCPPTMIVQHMPAKFIDLFAQRLNSVCAPSVSVARGGMKVEAGRILIAPHGTHMRLSRRDPSVVMLEDRPPVNGFRPSVDVLFTSGADAIGKHCVAALLTGMGRDGATGLKKIREAGGVTLAQDEETSVVYGMPRVANEMGAVDKPLPLGEIANALLKPCRSERMRDAS
ncbi:chemotaxis response regulator protein-glutamate methylesterase [Parvularcula sp. ZS-1/3]|uniref:Protein-glutamate methylesterase/protein-glutamine glutaminase n=1 Tax=Parvularcula mediterranea TaxID=2732508 RepID=A0A7Y3RLN9_9PROT|nr:chemotaxis response regulator protein-glutamate methylesterase [Parvularcula mediterranea]NNU16309.1 chemotaxis response regulator protein-glutamate methylesterase [Parvularcula mediterranea]